MVCRTGGGTSRPKKIPGMGCSHLSTWAAKRLWKGPISGLKGHIRTRLGRFKSPRKKNQTRNKGSGGAVEVGRRGEGASPPKPDTRFETLMPGKTINSNSEDGSGGMWWWVGRD